MGRDPFHQSRLLQAPSNLTLNPAREGAATASLGNLGQGLTTLRLKNFFLLSNLNPSSFSLKPLPLVLSLHGHPGGVSPGQSRGADPLPHRAAHAAGDARLDCWATSTQSGHAELLAHQHPQVLLLRAALHPFSTQPVYVLGIASTHAQDPVLGLVEFHKVRTGPPLQPVQVPLDGWDHAG